MYVLLMIMHLYGLILMLFILNSGYIYSYIIAVLSVFTLKLVIQVFHNRRMNAQDNLMLEQK